MMKNDNKVKFHTFILLSPFIFLFLINFISADIDFGRGRQGDCVLISYAFQNSTYSNISSILVEGNSSYILDTETAMNKSGTRYNYTLCETNVLGYYQIIGHNDRDGNDTVWVGKLQITPSGESGNLLGLFILIFAIAWGISLLGLGIKSEWLTIFGGMAMMILGIYTFNNGIDIYRSWITDAFSLFTAGFGLILTAAGIEEALNI